MRLPEREERSAAAFDPERDITEADWKYARDAIRNNPQVFPPSGASAFLSAAAAMRSIGGRRVDIPSKDIEHAREAIFPPDRTRFEETHLRAACCLRELGHPSPLTETDKAELFIEIADSRTNDKYYDWLPETVAKLRVLGVPFQEPTPRDFEKMRVVLAEKRSEVPSFSYIPVWEYLYHLKLIGAPGIEILPEEWRSMRTLLKERRGKDVERFFELAHTMAVLAADEVKIEDGRIIINMHKPSAGRKEAALPPESLHLP